MKIVVAIDSFKGCLTATETNEASAEGILSIYPNAEIVSVPVSDGGEGFLEAFGKALAGSDSSVDVDTNTLTGSSALPEAYSGIQEITVRDPMMRPVSAKYLLWGKTAVIEIAQASGLTLLKREERNPLVATSYGTGQLVVDAIRKGAEHIIVGLGGSATSDAGIGMLRAIIEAFAKHGQWDDVEEMKHVRFTIASDVKNPLCGENGAAHVFGPQKGATEEMVRQLDERARKFAEVSAKHFGYDRSREEGAGAAGGLGYAFLQYLNAECKPGIQLLLETIKFDEIVKGADLIITGEGSADRQTLMGKLPMGILHQSGGVPVFLIAGKIGDRDQLLEAGFAQVACINPVGIPLEEAMRKEVATRNIRETMARLLTNCTKRG